jgi:hypothetical protein
MQISQFISHEWLNLLEKKWSLDLANQTSTERVSIFLIWNGLMPDIFFSTLQDLGNFHVKILHDFISPLENFLENLYIVSYRSFHASRIQKRIIVIMQRILLSYSFKGFKIMNRNLTQVPMHLGMNTRPIFILCGNFNVLFCILLICIHVKNRTTIQTILLRILLLIRMTETWSVIIQTVWPPYLFFPSVNGNWGKWGAWTSCSRPCGTGKQTRKRLCNNPAAKNGGKDCVGVDTDGRYCNTDACPGMFSGSINEPCLAKGVLK